MLGARKAVRSVLGSCTWLSAWPKGGDRGCHFELHAGAHVSFGRGEAFTIQSDMPTQTCSAHGKREDTQRLCSEAAATTLPGNVDVHIYVYI